MTHIRQQSSKEAIASRWWETEAEKRLFLSEEPKEIKVICCFVPFQYPDTQCRQLAKRENGTLENILKFLGDERKVTSERKEGEMYQSDKEIRSLRLAEEVVRFLDDSHSSSSTKSAWNWKWEAPDHGTIAENISSQVSSVFSTVTFSDWIRIALNYGAKSF